MVTTRSWFYSIHERTRIAPLAVLRRREQTRFIVCERRRSRRVHRRDPRRDVRAADLQAEPTKRIPKAELILRDSRFVGFDEDGGSTANIAASEASH